jgi:trehalose 6-phosphate synthase
MTAKQHMPRPTSLRQYIVVGLVVLVGLTLAAAPFSKSLVEQWARRDVESRSRLVFNSIQGPIVRALAAGDADRLALILNGVAEDERILAVGLCDADGVLRGATALMPQTFSCDKVARSEGESFSSIVNDGRRVLVGSFPIVTRDAKTYLTVLHDLAYLDARSGQVQAYLVATLFGLAIIVAGLGAVLVIFVLRGWTASLRQAVDDMRAGRSPLLPRRERFVLDQQIQKVLKNLEVGRTPTETAEIEWSTTGITMKSPCRRLQVASWRRLSQLCAHAAAPGSRMGAEPQTAKP